MKETKVFSREAVAGGIKAQEQGVARLSATYEGLHANAEATIGQAQGVTRFLMEKELIPPVPTE